MKHYCKRVLSLMLIILVFLALSFIPTTRVNNVTVTEAEENHNYTNKEALQIITSKLSKVNSDTEIDADINSYSDEPLEDVETDLVVDDENEIEVEVEVNESDLYVLAHLIMGEAANCDYEIKHLVGCVVVNRVNSEWFPDSYYDVAFQSGQYQCTWGGGYYQEPNDECWEVARELLINGVDIPTNVVWQAEFIQGDVYAHIGNQYFCYKN